MAVAVMRTMASRGFRIFGSGTFSTLTSLRPIQQTAFIISSLTGAAAPDRRALCCFRFRLSPHAAGGARLERAWTVRLACRGGDLAGLEYRFHPAKVFANGVGGVLAE